MDRNQKGQMLLNPNALAKQAAGTRYSRYNGGWIKTVTGLNKLNTDGYSLRGEFLNEDRLQWISPSLYLDCSISGSRKNQSSTHNLFVVDEEGQVALLETIIDARDWAPRLWPAIEEYLAGHGPKLSELAQNERQEFIMVARAAMETLTPEERQQIFLDMLPGTP